MAKLIIIGHLERAEALKPGYLFGYTISVGWSESVRPVIDTAGVHPLLPWSWKPVQKIQLFGKTNGNWASIGAFDVIAEPGSANTTNITAQATTRYSAASSVQWPDPSSGAAIRKLDVSQDESQPSDPWPAHVIEMSGLPFPVAQHLNLSFVFQARQDLGKYSVFAAAPVLAKDLNLDGELPPSGFQASRTSDGYAVYDQGASSHPFEIVAASNIVDPLNAAATTVTDNQDSQAIRILGASLGDWQREFLVGASRLFSVPAFIQFVLAPPKGSALTVPKDSLIPTLVAAGVACLRDVVSVGRDAGPLGGFPGVRQLLNANQAVDKAVFDTAYKSTFAGMQDWTDFLQKNLPGTSRLSVWNLIARDKDSGNQNVSDPKLYLGQLKRDFSTILAPIANESTPGDKQSVPPRHMQLMSALWGVILDNLTKANLAPKNQIDAVRSGLPAALEDTSYTSLWLDETLGMFWQNILDHSGAGANPLLVRTRDLSKYFLLSRLGLPITAQETPANLPAIWRSIPTDWMPSGSQLTDWYSAKPLLLGWIDSWQDSVASSFDPSGKEIPNQNLHNPLPVHLQYSSFYPDNDPGEADVVGLSQPDLFRDIRGVGLLVKEQNYAQWTVVNLNAAIDVGGNQCVASPVGFPLRSGYVAKIRRGLIAYEGEPLSGGTALDNIDGLQHTLNSKLPTRAPLLSSDYHPAVQTPQLKYGRNFSFATFSILNSGILPPLLRGSTAEPRAWKSSCASLPGGWAPATKLYQRTTKIGALRVLREDAKPNQPAVLPSIPAGTYPRARDIDWALLWKGFQDALKPVDPVKPLDPDKLNLVLLSPDAWTSKSSTPKSSYQFRVRLPEVTWREWSAWGASLPSRNATGLPDPSQPVIPLNLNQFRRHREDIIEECFTSSIKEEDAKPAVDDPCLARLLYVELLEEAGGKLALRDDRFVKIADLLGTKGRSLYQAAGASVICRHNGKSASSLSLDESRQEITANIQEGKVAVLRIWACVPVEYQRAGKNASGQSFDQMFAPDVLPAVKHPRFAYKEKGKEKTQGKDHLLVSSYDLLVEAATPDLPAPNDLFAAFQASLRIRESDPSVAMVTASLPNPAAGSSVSDYQKFLNIGSVKAKRQSWRWEGRPVPLHPSLHESAEFGPGHEFVDAEREWIWTVYSERPDGEADPLQLPVRRPVSLGVFDSLLASGCRCFESADGLSAADGPAQPQLDLRGSHFRFSVQVTSRYESLMKLAGLNPSRFAHPDLPPDSNTAPKSLAWRSTFVPSRVTEPGVPKLRLLLPLTEAYDSEESKSSSLLAVFDDIFYDEVGLGDTLDAEMESIPVERSNPQQFVVQAGKDVLQRSGKDETPSLKPYRKDREPPPVKIALDATHPTTKWSGPIGNYRDFNNRYARFLASSFIIPAPTRSDGTAIDARNWMASIRFRRTARTRDFPVAVPRSAAFKDYSGEDLLRWGRPASYSSCWTDTYWVQFVGSFSRFDGFDHRIADLLPLVDTNGVLTLSYAGKPVALKPTLVPNFKDSRRLYAVVTQRAFDFRGQYNQEIPVAILQQDTGDPRNWRSTSKIEVVKQLKSDFRVRIIEASFATAGPRANQQPVDPEDLFRDLFQFTRVSSATPDVAPISGRPRYSPVDASGSILRVSEPANSVASDGTSLDLCEIKEPGK
jgi:hypothetical protein